MKILGIDTSTKFLCIGFFDNSKIYEYRLNLGMGHCALLLPSIKRILDSLQTEPKSIDYLAVGLGPGSFTGIRIALSTIKGLAVALNKKVVGIASLDIIAYNALAYIGDYKFVCSVLDAKRDLVYASLYRKVGDSLKKKMPYKLTTPLKLIKAIPKKTIFLGDALKIYKDLLTIKTKESKFLDEEFYYPKATNIIKIALERIEKNGFHDIKRLRPIYLYPKECQIRKCEV